MIFQILIVDDEPHVVDAIRGILEQEPAVDITHSSVRSPIGRISAGLYHRRLAA